MPDRTVEDYNIGWLCALPKEMTAALSMLDEEHPDLEGQQRHDNNNYALGRIHRHNVVIACMPAGADGLVNAATAARDMARTFPSLRVCLMVGIGGGIPNLPKDDIRLGDVVVSQPDGTLGGVVQYDKGKAEKGGQFVIKGQLNQAPPVLLQTLARLQAEHGRRDSWISRYMKEAIGRNPRMGDAGYTVPKEPDCLHCRECDHSIESLVGKCTARHQAREQRNDDSPMVHYGIVASGNSVIKDAQVRDDLREQFGALCVEMEAAGLMNHFPCLVIRGVCDYADSHKNDAWHAYAAMTAAAYAKEFLYYTSPKQASDEKSINQVIGSLNDLRDLLQQRQTQDEEDKLGECHRALKTSPYKEYKDINPPRMPGTCEWVLHHPKYRAWAESSRDGLLWISADPGCGKSVLAKSLIDMELKSTETHTVCYFFFKDNEKQGSLTTALCAILHQLFSRQRHLIRHAIPAWGSDGIKLSGETSELWRIWLAAARDPEANNVTCVLDALDECDNTERTKLISLLTEFYRESFSFYPTRSRQVRILVTSRPYDEILHDFNTIPSELPTIHLRGENENDKISKEIDLVIRARVGKLAVDLNLHPNTTRQLETKLLEMKHRTYLWLHLAADDIVHTFRKSLRPNQQFTNEIPSTVEQAYEKILSRVEQTEQSIVKQILQIVVGARRPLTTGEMAIALGISTSTDADCLATARIDHDGLGDRIRDLCGLFVFVNHTKIYLIHQTAKAFLVRKNEIRLSRWRGKWCLASAETETGMARICVEFLCFKDIANTAQSLIARLNSWMEIKMIVDEANAVESFLVYASEYWHCHMRDAVLGSDSPLMNNIFQLYGIAGEVYSHWFPIYWKTLQMWANKLPPMDEVALASIFGHDRLLEFFLTRQEQFDVNASGALERTPLAFASRLGYVKVVKVLVTWGVDVNKDATRYPALYAAAENGHGQIVLLLLGAGADIDIFGSCGTALQAAFENGHEEVVRMLLVAGANVDVGNHKTFGPPLLTATRRGNEKIIRLLLEAGADANLEDSEPQKSPLFVASDQGHDMIVRMLLDAGADVHVIYERTGTALHVAVSHGHEGVVRQLLAAGADVNICCEEHGTALCAAAIRGDEEIVRLLLEAGADVNACYENLGTALYKAASNGYEEVVRQLLAEDADVNICCEEHGTALCAAARRGDEEIVRLLLLAGADVHVYFEEGGTALHEAAGRGDRGVVRRLLEAGADVNAYCREFGTALREAASGGHTKVVGQLLTAGAHVNHSPGKYGTALYAAAYYGNKRVVRQLLDAGANVNDCYDGFGTALHAAARSGHRGVVRLLLDAGVDVHVSCTYFRTALHIAANRGHQGVVRQLLDAGAENIAFGD